MTELLEINNGLVTVIKEGTFRLRDLEFVSSVVSSSNNLDAQFLIHVRPERKIYVLAGLEEVKAAHKTLLDAWGELSARGLK